MPTQKQNIIVAIEDIKKQLYVRTAYWAERTDEAKFRLLHLTRYNDNYIDPLIENALQELITLLPIYEPSLSKGKGDDYQITLYLEKNVNKDILQQQIANYVILDVLLQWQTLNNIQDASLTLQQKQNTSNTILETINHKYIFS